jgi:hypothetical protein
MIANIPNPEAYLTIATQLDAEADAHEDLARTCRREAMQQRLTANYIKILSQVAKATNGGSCNG